MPRNDEAELASFSEKFVFSATPNRGHNFIFSRANVRFRIAAVAYLIGNSGHGIQKDVSVIVDGYWDGPLLGVLWKGCLFDTEHSNC